MWAITPKGVGEEVGARRVRADWPLAAGETFTVEHWEPGMRLAEDGESLRTETAEERQARDAGPQPSYRDLRAEEYRKRLGKLPDNTQMETVGDVLDAVIKALGGDATELQGIAAEVAEIKAEIPKPAGG